MTNKKQEAVDELWEKYRKTLELLNNALDELAKKPKEVVIEKEVEKVVEVEANIDLNIPESIAELEKQIQQKLGNDGQ